MPTKTDKELTVKIKEYCKGQGADLVGVASQDRFALAPEGHRPTDILKGAENVISCAIHLSDTVFDGLPDRMCEYTNHHWTINGMLNSIGTKTTLYLEKLGYRAIPIAVVGFYIKELFRGALSHRHAAVEAGLGEIGYNNLLVTPEYGPRVRLVSIVTDAPLESDPKLERSLCQERRDPKSPQFCQHACIKNTPDCLIPIDNNKHTKINPPLCRFWGEHVIGKNYISYTPIFVCGLCVSQCPIGFKGNRGKA